MFHSSSSEPINDLDWTSTPDKESILAVGFTHQVQILAQQRKTYFDDNHNWAVVYKIQIGRSVPAIEILDEVDVLLAQFHSVPNQ